MIWRQPVRLSGAGLGSERDPVEHRAMSPSRAAARLRAASNAGVVSGAFLFRPDAIEGDIGDEFVRYPDGKSNARAGGDHV